MLYLAENFYPNHLITFACMDKRRIIKSMDTLSEDLKDLLMETYPRGYGNNMIRLTNSEGQPFFVVPLDTEDTIYLVKVATPKPGKAVADDDIEDDDDFDDDADSDGGTEDLDDDADEPGYEPDFDK